VSINLVQKEVDMLMGLDIAWIAAQKMVDKIVLLTGDADMIPAMNFAREHGMLVFVAKFGYYLSDKLREHADAVVEFNLPAPERTGTTAVRVVSMPVQEAPLAELEGEDLPELPDEAVYE
jgi:hypothetical protein